MKRAWSLLVAISIMLLLCACQSDFGTVNLQDPILISSDGLVDERIINQIKNENAIVVFNGQSGNFDYEWTIFGSDIAQPKTINLAVAIEKKENNSLQLTFSQEESFGFNALLSVHLDELWDAQSATGYVDDKAVASVSLTGSKTTILNIIVDGTYKSIVIEPDDLPEETIEAELEVVSEQETSDVEETEETTEATTEPTIQRDNYLSNVKDSENKVYTDGKDKYQTDPIPAGKPKPVEPEDQEINKKKAYTCTFSIECSTILNNLDMLDADKLEMVPSNGVILKKTKVTFYKGESVYDVLQRLCKEKGIHMESSWTPIYNSAYIEGIHNLYEFDCGHLSGWMYRVNGWYPNYGCSRYQLKDGDVVEWRYTCDLGNDVGGKNLF